MGNIIIKSVVLGWFCFLTAGMAAKDQKIPEWKDETNVPEPSRYESFMDGVPDHWKLIGEGSLSINPWHYKLGTKSLQWNYKPGDIIRINNTLGNTKFRGGVNNVCHATFGVWIYNKEPLPGKHVRFEFREGEEDGAYFDFPLNFKGWQCAFLRYDLTRQADMGEVTRESFSKPVTGDIDNILVHAPAGRDGQILIDCLVYNGPTYYFINYMARPEPFVPPVFDETEYPLPDKVSESDSEAIERVKATLATPVILEKETPASAQNYERALERINHLNIVEDEHGIRGRPINMPRWHGSGASRGITSFFLDNGIPEEKLEWYNRAIIRGGAFSAIQRAITSGVTQEQYNELVEHGALIWKYLLDQGFNASQGSGHHYTGTYSANIAAAYVVREALFEKGLMDDVLPYLQYRGYPFFAQEAPIISMDYFNAIKTFLYGAFLISDDEKEQLRTLRFLSERFSREITGDYGFLGFKPDGAGYHGGFAFTYMQGGIHGICELAYLLSNSSFALSDEAYERLKCVVTRMYFYSNRLDVPLFLQGTSVFGGGTFNHFVVFRLPALLKYLAFAGKDGLDMELAQAYVNIKEGIMYHHNMPGWPQLSYDPVFEEEYGIEPSDPPQGNISMPYASLVAHRRADWVAIAWGGGVDMRDRGNHWGYFLANAPLAIMGKDGLTASGTVKDGLDWNRMDGATAPYMPDLIDIAYIHSGRKTPPERAEQHEKVREWRKFRTTDAQHDTRGNGGISWRGINGCFRKVITAGSHAALFDGYRAIKSYFFIDNRIYAMGSDITSYGKEYPIQTTIYQKALPEQNRPSWINGEKVTDFPVPDNALASSSAGYLIDSVGNGYFIPAGQNLYTARKPQESRIFRQNKYEDTVGDFATAWLDHGTECEDTKYVYVVMPYCDPDKLAEFSEDDFEILQQNGNAHILHDKMDGFYAGIFFEGGAVKNLPHVKEVERACQIMYRENDGALEIAVGDPATHRWRDEDMFWGNYGGKSVLTPLQVVFAGAWELEEPVEGVKILSSDKKETVMKFACIHGKTFDFTLIKKRPWWRRLF